MQAAFRQKGFRRLFVGLTTSMFGDSVMLLVLSMWVKSLTGSNAAAGLTFFWMLLPALIAPLLGMLVDRFRPRVVLVSGSIASAAAVLPLTLVHSAEQVWVIWAVAFLYGISFIVLPAALNGLLKELVPDEQLVSANSSLQTVKERLRLVGPLVGAALFVGFGGGAVALLDAASFLAAAAIIAGIPVRAARPVRESTSWWHELTAGARHLGADPLLRHTLVAFGILLLVLGFIESSLYAVADAFGQPVQFVSIVVTVQGVGAVVGGLTATWLVRRIGEIGAITLGAALMSASLALVASTHSIVVLLADVPFFGYSIPLMVIAFTTLVQRRTPLALMGRVSAATEVVMGTPQALSLAVGALLVTLLDYHVIYALMATGTGLAAGYLLLVFGRRIRHPLEPWSSPTPQAGPPPAFTADRG